MKIALCQLDTAWEDKAATKQRILSLMSDCSPKDRIDWLVFPEMTLSGFSMDLAKTTLDAADLAFFSDLARSHRACVSFGGVQDGRNNLITMDTEGRVISTYSKAHLFSLGRENTAYRRGGKPERFILNNLSVVPAVCYDLRFPYLFWNEAARTDLFVVIANWPAQRTEHWMRLLQARAIENQCYVVGVNRAGQDPLLSYSGNSMIFDPMGRTLLSCPQDEGLFVAAAEVDKSLVAQTRAHLPFLKDRRPGFAVA